MNKPTTTTIIDASVGAIGAGARGAFTLIELLVTMATISLLLGVLLPSLGRARESARSAVCGSNLRQLFTANDFYQTEHAGRLVAGAPNFRKNLHRWHGVRESLQQPFDPARGPLRNYLGADGRVKECPSFEAERKGFESGCGGYGYNNAYLGRETLPAGTGLLAVKSDLRGVRIDAIAKPIETIMFTDAAFAESALIEYSFAEPRFLPEWGGRADPSIHFRHLDTANVLWTDGHVSAETLSYTRSSGLYPSDPEDLNIGWFGRTDDNRLFDLE